MEKPTRIDSEKKIEHEPRQLELFIEHKPKMIEQFERVKYAVSILGGEGPKTEESAEKVGYDLVKNWFSITTGGYNFGTMNAALQGGNRAMREIKANPENRESLGLFNPVVKAVIAESFQPEAVAKGEHIKTEAPEGEYSLYFRLGKLIEDSRICIILPGGAGTELEVMANLNFDKKLKGLLRIPSKPVIFIGESHIPFLKERFSKVISNSHDVYVAANEDEAVEVVNKLFQMEKISTDGATEELLKVKEYLDQKLLRFSE